MPGLIGPRTSTAGQPDSRGSQTDAGRRQIRSRTCSKVSKAILGRRRPASPVTARPRSSARPRSTLPTCSIHPNPAARRFGPGSSSCDDTKIRLGTSWTSRVGYPPRGPFVALAAGEIALVSGDRRLRGGGDGPPWLPRLIGVLRGTTALSGLAAKFGKNPSQESIRAGLDPVAHCAAPSNA